MSRIRNDITPRHSAQLPPHTFFLDERNARVAAGGAPRVPLHVWGNMVAGVIFLTLLIIVAPFMQRGIADIQTFQRGNATVEGVVLDKEEGTDSDGYATYHVTFQYGVGGQGYARRESVSETVHNRVRLQEPVTVRYALANPNLSTIADGYSTRNLLLINAVGVGLFMVGLAAVLFGAYRGWEWRTMVRRGVVLPAQVLSASSKRDSDGDVKIDIRYTFAHPVSRHRAEGRVYRINNRFAKRALPERGQPAAVLFHSDNAHELL